MTAKKWGVPVIVCGPHYEPVVYPNDRIANVRVECCGLPDDVARKEGCEAYRDRMLECSGPEQEGCWYNDAPAGNCWLTADQVRDCDYAEACPLVATLPRAKVEN